MERHRDGRDAGDTSRAVAGGSGSQQASTSASTSDAHESRDTGVDHDTRCDINDNDGPDDNDSAYEGDSLLFDTTSMNSEVTKYRMEHGRQYHGYKDGAYWVCFIREIRSSSSMQADPARDQTTNKLKRCWTLPITCTA